MNEVKPFVFEGKRVRTVLIEDEPYFIGNDAAVAIGYSNPRDAINRHVKSKYRRVSRITTPSGVQEMTVISEPGVYQLASQSKLPSAEPFQDWIYEQVLPAIRRDGAYLTPQTAADWLNNPDMMIDVLQRYKVAQAELEAEHTKRLVAEQQVHEYQPKATYYDLILRSKSLLSVSKISKDYGMSARKMNSLLHDLGVQFKQGDIWLLYAKYQDKGYTQTSTYALDEEHSKVSTKWTQTGRIFIYNLLKEQDILPLIEQTQLT